MAKQEKIEGNPDAVVPCEKATGYLAKYDETIIEHGQNEGDEPVVLKQGDRVRVPTWIKEILGWKEDEKGILITIPEVIDRHAPTMIVEKRVDVNLGLEGSDVELLVAMCKKVRFTVEETFELGKYRTLVNKLQGFEQLPLTEENVRESDGESEPSEATGSRKE